MKMGLGPYLVSKPVKVKTPPVSEKLDSITHYVRDMLRPHVKRLSHPCVVDAFLRLTFSIQHGDIDNLRYADSEPGYVDSLTIVDDETAVLRTTNGASNIVRSLLQKILGCDWWYGKVTVSIAFNRGEATISSEVDQVCKVPS